MSKFGILRKALTETAKKIPDKLGVLPTETNFDKTMKKAKEQGFDEDTYYHVTTQDFDKFSPRKTYTKGLFKDENLRYKTDKRGATYFTKDVDFLNDILSETTRKKGLRIMPVKIKTDNLFDIKNYEHLKRFEKVASKNNEYMLMTFFNDALKGYDALYRAFENPNIQRNLKEAGFRGFKLDANDVNVISEKGSVGLFYPEKGDVRGKFAQFDEGNKESGNIMANIAGATTIGALSGLEEGT